MQVTQKMVISLLPSILTMEFQIHTLNNGIRVIHKQTNRTVSHCGLVINSGSRDELADEHGLAHFIEHGLFKGTKKRKTHHILNRLDVVGGELNASTSKEDTWVHASFLNAHYERALDLIADIVFNSTFPEKEISKEKDVIIDEINSYLDSPDDTIFDEFESMIFSNHPLGRTILGTAESVKKLTSKNALDMIHRCYRTDKMVFSSVSSLPLEKVVALTEKYLGNFYSPSSNNARTSFSKYQPNNIEINKDTFQVHYLLGNIAYSETHANKTGLILLNNYLGGPSMNNKLSMNIREKHGLAYNIESSYIAYQDTGFFSIYLGTDKKFFEKSKKLIYKELQKLRENKLGTLQLHQAKQQLVGQIALGQDSGLGTMLALGKSLLVYNKVDSMEKIFSKIESISASHLLEIANEVFDETELSSLAYLS